MEAAVAFKVTWTFGDDQSESRTFYDELEAREEGYRLSHEYATKYGRCEMQLHKDGQLIIDMRQTHCA